MDAWRRDRAARERVAAENHSAALLDANDPRWVLAVRTQALLEGQTLSPQRRESLLKTARQLGVRIFDASVIIAIVQDAARRGESLGASQEMLSLVPAVERPKRSAWSRWIAAAVLAALANIIMIWWLLGG